MDAMQPILVIMLLLTMLAATFVPAGTTDSSTEI